MSRALRFGAMRVLVALAGAQGCQVGLDLGAVYPPDAASDIHEDAVSDRGEVPDACMPVRSGSFTVSLAELAAANAGCSLTRATLSRGYSIACLSAAHRICVARGCYSAGFGLNEAWNDATITCLVGDNAAVRATDYAALSTFDAACDGRVERFGPACNRAITRFCERESPGSAGFGPVEADGGRVSVVCVPPASVERYETTYAALTAAHPDCDGVFERSGPQCNAAIHRFCMVRLQRSGFGPIDDDGGRLTIACVRP